MPVPKTFKAAVLPEARSHHVLSTRSLAPLEKGEVAIKITATAINPVDWKIRDYNAYVTKYPAVIGSDAAGEIADVGSEVSGFAVGDRVFFQGIVDNFDAATFQQYCKVPAKLVGKTPSNISDEQASGISLATVAVLTAYYDATGHGLTPPWGDGGEHAGKGKAIVILGGSSSVGQYAIQLARLSGFSKIITNSSAAHIEHLKSLGAYVVLDRSQSGPEDFASAIGDLPLAFVFDAISIEATQILGVKIIQLTKTENTHVIGVLPSSDKVQELCQQEPRTSFKFVLGIGSKAELRYLSEPLMANLGGEEGYITKGLFRPNKPVVVPGGLAAIEAALDKNKNGVSGEKVVIRPFED
ncbi:quinone reductase [Xylariaceae sp. FL0662B]|nr:quinone reductase [Xylariaceae sp. FL0662B]